MKKVTSNKARALRNVFLLLLLTFAVDFFSGLPIPIPEIQFRKEERAHLVGPGDILGIEEIDFSHYETMIAAETEEGVILWVSGKDLNRSDLVYKEKNGGDMLLAAPGYLGYMTVADEVHLPLVLFDQHPRAVRAELRFTLREIVNGEEFEKTYFLSADREKSGYFLFTLNAESDWPEGSDAERLTLQIFANIASGQDKQLYYNVPIQMWFYNSRNELIAEETIAISGN